MGTDGLLVASLAEFLAIFDVKLPRATAILGAGFSTPKSLVLYVRRHLFGVFKSDSETHSPY